MNKTLKYILIFFCAVFYIAMISGIIYLNFVQEHFIPPSKKSKIEHKHL
ncbi:hypothetical protein FOC75_10830 [Bacillus cereus]|nr:hypothetical protein [Bacillus cereus]MDQ4437473.1 hypothetical protein [Bacillus cereus]QKH66062.1 hypothetical protein FOC75_10830 [Bacillus cereus]QKH72441.1 hypothetical protein FOC74_05260 [Bacillus cereus]